MNNNRNKWRRAGYTAVLLLCVAAVGVSGYVFVTTAVRQSRQEAALSVPLTTEKPQPTEPAGSIQPHLQEPEKTPEKPDPLLTAKPPVEGQVLHPYSATALQYDPTNRDWRLHSAVDVAAEGQSVRAVMAGTVKSVTEDDLLGCVVTVTHEGGYESRYGCLDKEVSVAPGDAVSLGHVLGAVGEGLGESALGPHLHFELLKDGESIDPTILWQQKT